MTMTIRIKNLRLRAVIGVNDWERQVTQDLVVNAAIEIDGARAAASDDVAHTLDYKQLTHEITELVEKSQFFLVEKLAAEILQLILAHPRALSASVEVDKPGAVRLCDSVSVSVCGKSRP